MRFGALSWRGLKLAISADNHAFRTEWNPKKKKMVDASYRWRYGVYQKGENMMSLRQTARRAPLGLQV